MWFCMSENQDKNTSTALIFGICLYFLPYTWLELTEMVSHLRFVVVDAVTQYALLNVSSRSYAVICLLLMRFTVWKKFKYNFRHRLPYHWTLDRKVLPELFFFFVSVEQSSAETGFLRVLQFSPASTIPPILHIHLYVALITRRSKWGRSLGTFR
jgi:hypothetical protein